VDGGAGIVMFAFGLSLNLPTILAIELSPAPHPPAIGG
jgi:hypothetical protein